MEIIFSWFGDSGNWPEHPGKSAAVVDSTIVGPSGFLDQLETFLGLGRPKVSNVQRIAAYRRKLEQAGPNRFWDASFSIDPWSATRELLSWRDELITAGWRPGMAASRTRFVDLAAAEVTEAVLPLGESDRLRAVVEELRAREKVPLTSVMLIDEREDLPNVWKTILSQLEDKGVKITASYLDGADSECAPRLTLLNADTEIAASEALVAWLASQPNENANIVFVLGHNTSLLDRYMANAGLPTFGKSAISAHRSLLQILPLAFSLTWEPPNPNNLLDFLLLPITPISRRAAHHLARAVSKEPGIGGDQWLKAWEIIENEPPANEKDLNKYQAKVAEWRNFIEPTRYSAIEGMPKSAARELAGRIASWAFRRSSIDPNPLLITLVDCARDLSIAMDTVQADRLDKVLVDRMIEEAIGLGVNDPSAVAEAAPWRAVLHPGGVWGTANTIVWWQFTDPSETSSKIIWNDNEQLALADAGCPLDAPDVGLKRVSSAWRRPYKYAKQDLIFIRSTLRADDETAIHPFWHTLIARDGELDKKVRVNAEALLSEESFQLAGRVVKLSAVAGATSPDRRDIWRCAPNKVERRPLESAKSLGSLLSCPLKWTLEYASKLEAGSRQSMQHSGAVIGTLAHKISQEVFHPGVPPAADMVASYAERRLEELLPKMAANLLLPGSARELAAVRKTIPEALAELAKFLENESLDIIATEYAFSESTSLSNDVGMRGSIDLLARKRSGQDVVIDLKWQRNDKSRREELKNGVALQLAVYARHVGDQGADAPTGYFMLQQKRFLTTDIISNRNNYRIDGPRAKETWELVTSSWATMMEEVDAGAIRATFEHVKTELSKFDAPPLLTPPSCKFCQFAGICREAK